MGRELVPQQTKTLPEKGSGARRIRIPVTSDRDIIVARQRVWELASEANFTRLEATLIATAISELARNIHQHAGRGAVSIKIDDREEGRCLIVVARDHGPGISDLETALQDGVSAIGGLGMGLPGVRRLMDEFEIVSRQNRGTTVIAKKWVRRSTAE
jgi:serine/threonine-protein kinase RsbT